MPAFDKNHGEAMRKAVKSGREVAESLGLFGTDLMRTSLSFRHAPGVIRTHNLLIRSHILLPSRKASRQKRRWAEHRRSLETESFSEAKAIVALDTQRAFGAA